MSSIVINGASRGLIKSARGLRQGDPLSPLLFVLVADVFNRMIKLAISNNIFQGIKLPNSNLVISNLQFADDTILFASPMINHIHCLKVALYSFELISGLSINFSKSSIIMLGNADHLGQTCSSLLNCKIAHFPISYLGVPIRPTKLHRSDWFPLIAKIENRLLSWKAHSLSSTGRLVLVKSSFQQFPHTGCCCTSSLPG